ncbi:MAG: protein kinase [Candidatus Eiseniibacteriota bacterium]
MIGKRLGHCEITALLGRGGMGEVYRARDTRLDRDVALKFLPEALIDDAERCARFEREGKVLASLNHANIATLHGIEDFEGHKALVMECAFRPTFDVARDRRFLMVQETEEETGEEDEPSRLLVISNWEKELLRAPATGSESVHSADGDLLHATRKRERCASTFSTRAAGQLAISRGAESTPA